MILLLQPVMSIAIAAVVLAERPSPLQLVGCAIVLAGIVVATAGGRLQPAPAPDDEAPEHSAQELRTSR
jgi:drug/metabolite transporter (DMT)-like permease